MHVIFFVSCMFVGCICFVKVATKFVKTVKTCDLWTVLSRLILLVAKDFLPLLFSVNTSMLWGGSF